jgi:hypothetical protein
MQLETNIKPRKDGTVRVVVPSGGVVVFVVDEVGRLVADVADDGDQAFLLTLGDFYPFDEADFVQAESLIREEVGIDDLPDDDGDVNAAPVEVVTPPRSPKPSKKVK